MLRRVNYAPEILQVVEHIPDPVRLEESTSPPSAAPETIHSQARRNKKTAGPSQTICGTTFGLCRG